MCGGVTSTPLPVGGVAHLLYLFVRGAWPQPLHKEVSARGRAGRHEEVQDFVVGELPPAAGRGRDPHGGGGRERAAGVPVPPLAGGPAQRGPGGAGRGRGDLGP